MKFIRNIFISILCQKNEYEINIYLYKKTEMWGNVRDIKIYDILIDIKIDTQSCVELILPCL